MSGEGGDLPRTTPPRPNAYWDNLSERRLDDVSGRLKELAGQLAEMAKEMRAVTRTSDQQASVLLHFEERFKGMARELDEFPKKVERLARAEELVRLETRIANIEDENKSPFARKSDVEPMKKILFGFVSALCLGVLGTVMKIVMK